MKCVMGIDIGTYSSKGVIIDNCGRIRAESQTSHKVEFPRQGWAEHDPENIWWNNFTSLAKQLLETSGINPKEIACIGVSAIAPCVVPVGNEGKPLRPGILYGIDTRATSQIEELNEKLGKEYILEVTGAELSSQSAGPKVLWLKQEEPRVWRETRYIMTSTSYVVFRLTGRVKMDYYTAAFYGPLYNLKKNAWLPESLSHVCDRTMLPELGWTTEIAGFVSSSASGETGLAEGTPVIIGTADAAAEAISGGVSSPGDMMLMYGSSHFMIHVTADLPQGGMFWPAEFLFPGTSVLAGGMSTTGALTQWFGEQFSKGGNKIAFSALAEAAGEVPPGSEGLLMLPYFSGERTPINDPAARGVIAGLTLRHTKGHVYRALLESVAFGIRHNLEAMTESAGPPKRIVSTGGGTKNKVWVQIISDVTGYSQQIFPTTGAAYGDAVLAAIGCGLLKNMKAAQNWIGRGEIITCNRKNKRLYDRLFPLYRQLYTDSRGVIHKLAREGVQ